MKLSILLPTRNGARFVRPCIEAVLRQASSNVELIVADNANTDGTSEILASYAGRQLRIVRHDEPVSVSENWESALNAATGDYFWMIGDDDLLINDGVEWVLAELDRLNRPDCLSFQALTYAAPGSLFEDHSSYWSQSHFHYESNMTSGSEITSAFRRLILEDLFRFRPRIPLNMQLTVFSRFAVEQIKRPFFRPPFPDHFALSAMLITARKWLLSVGYPLIVGVSPKSFGHFIYSGQSSDGIDYLGDGELPVQALPGDTLTSLMYRWLIELKGEYPEELAAVQVSRGDYVARQLWAWFVALRLGRISRNDLIDRMQLLTMRDISELLKLGRSASSWSLLTQALKRRMTSSSHSLDHALQLPGLRELPDVHSIVEFARLIETGKLLPFSVP